MAGEVHGWSGVAFCGTLLSHPMDSPPLEAKLRVRKLLEAFGHARSADAESATVEALLRGVLALAEQPDNQTAWAAAQPALRDAVAADGREDGVRLFAVTRSLSKAFDLDAGPVTAVLAPHVAPETGLPEADPAAALFDALRIAGLPTSVTGLGVDVAEAMAWVHSEFGDLEWVEAAVLGRRPSRFVARVDIGEGPTASVFGDVRRASDIILAIPGKGATADAVLARARELIGDAPGFAIVAPQSETNRWYATTYRTAQADPGLASAVQRAVAARDWALSQAETSPRVHLFGFSQGACVALELATAQRFASVIAIAGARPGPNDAQAPITAVAGTPMLLGASEADRWLDPDAVATTAAKFREAGATVDVIMERGEAHELSGRQRTRARELLVGPRKTLTGFGNTFESEALPDALPRTQNSPHRVAYGLYPEQLSGTGFTAARGENQRSWLYRLRPSAGHRPFAALPHPTFTDDFSTGRPAINLCGHAPLGVPNAPTDFIDGIHTYGGQGSAALRRGLALHLYVANRSMEHRSFYNADGDLLILPQRGPLQLKTEFGILDVGPGHLAVVPRGVRFSVLLRDSDARGYIGEIFGRHFRLPSRGVVGANGLADERHFVTPTAWFEDHFDPGHRLTAKHGGTLHETTLDRSPYDVVAWHGNYAPYAYDLSLFSPVSNVAFDHADPSVYIVLSAPLDEAGASTLDLVVFPPRWEPTEHTFRPAFFHRNAVTEWNGILKGPSATAFAPGCSFLTPAMTAHGVVARSVERAIDAPVEKPTHTGHASLWFQFETALELTLSAWARDAALPDWPSIWGRYRSNYEPSG